MFEGLDAMTILTYVLAVLVGFFGYYLFTKIKVGIL